MTILWLQDDSWREARKWRVTFLVGLAAGLTLALTARALWTDERLTLARLQDSNTALAQRITTDLHSVETSVGILQSHLRTSLRTQPDDFADMAAAIRAGSPHVQALSWNPLVADADRAPFEARLRKAYSPDAGLQDRTAEGTLVPSAQAAFYVAVEHIAPLELNRPALGLNVHANPVRRDAIDQAIATGRPATTARVQLAQENGKSWGALYLSPLYDAAPGAGTRLPVGCSPRLCRMP